MAIKDYYKILDVPRNATPNEIKRAYIKKARQCHPDQNQDDPEASEKFRAVNEAYEVLHNEEERKKYDRMGMFYTRDGKPPTPDELAQHFRNTIRDFFSSKGPNANGDKIEDKLEISLEDVFSKQKIPFSYSREIRCTECDGHGGDKNGQRQECSNCEGSGKGALFVMSCSVCSGQGFVYSKSCKKCHGDGRQYHTETIGVPLPENITVGKRIRIKGKGNQGYGTGEDGDLLLTVHFQKHPLFERRGSDLFCSLPIDWSVATLGGTVDIPTLEGISTIRIPPGTQSQKNIRLSGRGLPIDEKWPIPINTKHAKRGDIHYTIHIEVPLHITPSQKKLIQQLQVELQSASHPQQYPQMTEFSTYLQKRQEEQKNRSSTNSDSKL